MWQIANRDTISLDKFTVCYATISEPVLDKKTDKRKLLLYFTICHLNS